MNTFFYKNWWLYYLLLFLFIGWFIYSLMWHPHCGQTVEYPSCPEIECPEVLPPTTKEPTSPHIQCNNNVESGGQGTTTTIHDLGTKSGIVRIFYDMNNIPDQMDVHYDGQLVATTRNMVSHRGELTFNYQYQSNKPTYCKVTLSAPQSGTIWEYLLNCPE